MPRCELRKTLLGVVIALLVFAHTCVELAVRLLELPYVASGGASGEKCKSTAVVFQEIKSV